MTDWESCAFVPGQQVGCKTRFNEQLKGEVVAFDLSSKILVLKSPSTSGATPLNDLLFLVLDSVSEVKIIEEPQGECSPLPNIDTKFIRMKQEAAYEERLRLIEAVEKGVSQEGISLFTDLSKRYDPSSVKWKDNVKILVMNEVIISPPYKETDCQCLTTTMTEKKDSEALKYVKSNVEKFWDSWDKQKTATAVTST